MLTASVLLVGCDSNTTTATATSPSPAAARPSPAPTPTQRPRTLIFTVNGMNGDPAHGTIRVDVKTYGYTTTVTLMGLAPNTGHDITIEEGACPNPDYTNLHQTFSHAFADAKGGLTNVTSWTDAYFVPPQGRTFTVHNAGIPGITHIACANMTN